jgi:hypothetical protein
VFFRAASRIIVGFDFENDIGTTRGSSETNGHFETSFIPGYLIPPFGLALTTTTSTTTLTTKETQKAQS